MEASSLFLCLGAGLSQNGSLGFWGDWRRAVRRAGRRDELDVEWDSLALNIQYGRRLNR